MGGYGQPNAMVPRQGPAMARQPMMRPPIKAKAVKKTKKVCSHCGGPVGCKKCGAEM